MSSLPFPGRFHCTALFLVDRIALCAPRTYAVPALQKTPSRVPNRGVNHPTDVGSIARTTLNQFYINVENPNAKSACPLAAVPPHAQKTAKDRQRQPWNMHAEMPYEHPEGNAKCAIGCELTTGILLNATLLTPQFSGRIRSSEELRLFLGIPREPPFEARRSLLTSSEAICALVMSPPSPPLGRPCRPTRGRLRI